MRLFIMPTPQTDETRSEFISRCIPIVIEDGTAEDPQQAVAICSSMWEDGGEKRAEMYRYTYNGVTCQASRRRSSTRDDKAWMRDVSYDGSERLVHYADPDMPMRRNNEEARENFLARHNCSEKTDPFAAGFWACYDWANPDEKRGETMRETKTFNFTLKSLDYEGRTLEGYAAVFGNIDQGGDIIHSGAFAKTLAERGNKVRFLWQHDSSEPLGRLLEVREDNHGLYFKAIISDTQRGRDALALLRDDAINGLSIGYDAIPGGTDYSKADDGEPVRNLREIRLWEISLVTFPMNEAATTTALKRASGKTDLPLGARDRTWDSGAAIGRIRNATDSEEEPSTTYRNAFFWYDSNAPEQYGSYKLPFADVVNGELTAIPAGIFAAAAALSGARGGVDIPDSDRDAVESRIARYYTRMRREFDDEGIVPPWEKDTAPAESKVGRVISKANEARLMRAIESAHNAISAIEEILEDAGMMDEEEPEAPAEEDDAGRSDADKAGPQDAPTYNDAAFERTKLLTEIALLEV